MKPPAAHRLTAEHAEILAELEANYPESMRQGAAAIAHKLQQLDDQGQSLSWILESRGEAVGYLVAWPTDSMLDMPNPGTVILVDDIQVRSGHPNDLYRLLQLLAQAIEDQGLQRLPIEGVCRRNAYKLFTSHQAAIERLGYELVGIYEYWDDTLGEELCWMRWHRLGLGEDEEELQRPGAVDSISIQF